VVPAVYDALSARIAERVGFRAIGLGGFLVAASRLPDNVPAFGGSEVQIAGVIGTSLPELATSIVGASISASSAIQVDPLTRAKIWA